MAKKNNYTDIDLSKYDSGFQPTEEVNLANTLKIDAENAVNNYGPFSYARQGDYDSLIDSILNRKAFSYDLNGDALYQQYKDNYITQGKQAMMDAAGQAAAMTGGYGNSYAQTVGQQTYQGYLQGLNDKIPELYQLALNRYNSEGDRLATNYGILSSDRSNALAEHEAGYNRLVADRDYYANNYNAAYNRDYTTWNDNRTYDTSQYWNEYNTGYQAEQDALAHQLALDQLQLQRDQFDWEKSKPVSVDYAISNYSDIPKNVRSTLDDFVSLAADEEFVGPLSKKQTEDMLNKVNVYISGLVNSGQMSPAVGDALMAEYSDIIESR